jgi:hypothetical protein
MTAPRGRERVIQKPASDINSSVIKILGKALL